MIGRPVMQLHPWKGAFGTVRPGSITHQKNSSSKTRKLDWFPVRSEDVTSSGWILAETW